MLKPGTFNTDMTTQGLCALVLAGVVLLGPSPILAQSGSPNSLAADTPNDDDSKADVEQQKKLVMEIYRLTQSARTAKDYSAVLLKCDSAIAATLTAKNKAYVVSLKGWALNRRAGKRFELAQQLKRVGNAQSKTIQEQALKDFDDAIVSDPSRYRSFLSRGIAYMELYSGREADSAPVPLKPVVEPKQIENTESVAANLPVGKTIDANLKQALLDFTKVTQLQADESKGWFNRAEAFYCAGAFKESVNNYNVVLRFKSDDLQALTGRGLAQLALGLNHDALSDFEQVLDSSPNHAAALVNRGDAFAALGKWNLAMADFKTSLELASTPIAMQRLAWLQATCPESGLRDPVAALKLIVAAIESGGSSSTNLETLAAAEAANGNFEKAKSTQHSLIQTIGYVSESDSEVQTARMALYASGESYVLDIANPEFKNPESNRDGPNSSIESDGKSDGGASQESPKQSSKR